MTQTKPPNGSEHRESASSKAHDADREFWLAVWRAVNALAMAIKRYKLSDHGPDIE